MEVQMNSIILFQTHVIAINKHIKTKQNKTDILKSNFKTMPRKTLLMLTLSFLIVIVAPTDPTQSPSLSPTQPPSIFPSTAPTSPPSIAPSIAPTQPPSLSPSIA
eukprot:128295_1